MFEYFRLTYTLKGSVCIACNNCRIRFRMITLPLFFQYTRFSNASAVKFMVSIYHPDQVWLLHLFSLVLLIFSNVRHLQEMTINRLYHLFPQLLYSQHAVHPKIRIAVSCSSVAGCIVSVVIIQI
ncbi:MAG: hypothetical protein JWP71_1641 [Mucilaginibacter sp.]|nr:hypothetical protein [Mucilaginibacter sp.]